MAASAKAAAGSKSDLSASALASIGFSLLKESVRLTAHPRTRPPPQPRRPLTHALPWMDTAPARRVSSATGAFLVCLRMGLI